MGRRRWALPILTVFVLALVAAGTPGSAGASSLTPASPAQAARAETADLNGLVRSLERLGRAYGGTYVADGVVVVELTRPPTEADRQALARSLPAGVPLVLRRVSRSWDELLALQRHVTAEVGSLRRAGIQVSSVAVDAKANVVEVEISRASAVGAERQARGGHGDAVVVERDDLLVVAANDRTTNYPHLRAGVRIVASDSSYCTAGLHMYNSLGQYYSLIAGHCGNKNWYEGYYNSSTSHGSAIGATHSNLFANGTDCDCAGAGPLAAAKATPYVYTGPTTSVLMTSVGDRAQGQSVCYSGASTPTNPVKCGTVDVYPVDVVYTNYNNWTVKGLVRVLHNKIQPGDSGSPVYWGGTAVGIGNAFDNNNDRWYYTPVSRALRYYGSTLLTFVP
jgi:hypothetical protein